MPNRNNNPADGKPTGDPHIIERPDGFYWQEAGGDRLYGPFPTLLQAQQDMQFDADSDFGEGETLAEAESEIGISDWTDPDTGEPAEDNLPHLPHQ